MLSMITAVLLGQAFYTVPPLPTYDPAGYHRRHPEYIFPVGPPVGNPRTINLRPVGQVVSVHAKDSIFVVQYPGYQSRFHYGKGTRFVGAGKFEPGRWVHVDRGSYTVEMQ